MVIPVRSKAGLWTAELTWQRDRFVTYNELPTPQPVKLGDGREVNAIGQEQVKLSLKGKRDENITLTLNRVLLVPNMSCKVYH